ncbi:AlkP-core domain protein [Halobacterium hubeiense]|uniref:AlkP-core domain protein n=1 Tax=Halobacterium hubeiense TaxID=1407499 RepID=A0A0U5H033_9EURY|nr:sulfatase-like hydrolase/transferase [Halobacterium hubeiense]CQH55652.1 AlkP-core domain protein [Halobacterium hubeiense]
MSGKLLVTVDSLRYDKYHLMPATQDYLDASHETAFAVSTATPGSFPGILTGQYPTPGGIDEMAEFAAEFDGYTVGISTNHLLSERYGYGHAFDYFEAPNPGDMGLKQRVEKAVTPGTIHHRLLSTGWNALQSVRNQFKDVGRTFRPAEDVIETLLTQIEGRDEWLGWIHLMEPHHPYEPDDGEMGRVEAQNASRRVLNGNGSKEDETLVGRAYEQEIRELDATLSDLWDSLSSDTEVVFTADHGELLGEDYEPSWGHPGVMAPELLRVPFGTRNVNWDSGTVVSHIDIGSIMLGEPFGKGEFNRTHAYATYGEEKAVMDEEYLYNGTDFRTLNGDCIDANNVSARGELTRRWNRFDPDTVYRTDALKEDLQDLGYK